MRIAQYVRQERMIAAADRGGIRERRDYGLRVLNDPKMVSSEKSLKHNVTDQLIAAARAAGRKLSAREIRYRIQCARAYPTEAQIGKALADFETWWDLIQAGFPSYEAPPDEPLSDWRTKSERATDRARALSEATNPQGDLWPADRFDRATSALKEMREYAEDQAAMTRRFAERDRRRFAELEELEKAAGGDLSMLWGDAEDLIEDQGDEDQDDDA